MTTLTIDQAFQQAINYHRTGELPQAEQLYRAILQSQPNHPTANHNLGVLMVTSKKVELALPFLKKALDIDQSQVLFWLDYIDALIQVNQLDSASIVLTQAQEKGLNGLQTDALAERLEVAIKNSVNLSVKNKKITSKNGKQPSPKALKKLEDLYQQNNLSETEKYARELINQFPTCGYAYKLLSVVLAQTDRLQDAMPILRKAAALLPNDFEAQSNLGSILLENKQFSEAEVYLRYSLKIAKTAKAYFNLGFVLTAKTELSEAEACYVNALKIDPLYAAAHYALGVMLQNKNLLHEANVCYLKTLEIEQNGKAALDLAMNYYLQLDYSATNEFLKQASSIMNQPELKKFQFDKMYFLFMTLLLDWWEAEIKNTGIIFDEQNHGLPILSVIGESHSLAVHRTNFEFKQRQHRCHTHWLRGIKMWHLAQNTLHPMKQSVTQILSKLPCDMPVMFTIGEIDCRIDEGIWKTAKKLSTNYQILVDETVTGYLNWLENTLKSTGHQHIIIQGIPAPNCSLDQNSSDVPTFLAMIALVNQQLMFHSIAKGWQFLDVYTATVSETGRSNQQWHLDQHHLVPSFYAQAHLWLKSA